MVLVLCLSLYTVRLVMQALGVEDYGIYSVVCGFAAMLTILNTTLSIGVNRFLNISIGEGNLTTIRTILTNSILIQLIIGIIVVVLAETIGLWYIENKLNIPEHKSETASYIYQFAILSLLFSILQTPYSALITSYEKMGVFSLVSVVSALLKLLLALVIINKSFDNSLLVYGAFMMIITLMEFLIYYIYCRVTFTNINFSFKLFNLDFFKSMLSFSGWYILDPAANLVRVQGINMTLNYFFGPILNAAYGISLQISQALELFASNITIASRPQIIQSLATNEISRLRKILFTSTKLTVLLNLAICVPIILNTPYILELWMGPTIPDYSIDFTRLTLLRSIFCSFSPLILIAITATGKIRRYMILSSLIVTSTLFFSIMAFNLQAEPTIVFWIMILVSIVQFVLGLLVLNKNIPEISIFDYCKSIVFPSLIVFALYVGSQYIFTSFIYGSLLNILISTLISWVLLIILSWFLLLDIEEKKIVKSTIKKVLRIKSN